MLHQLAAEVGGRGWLVFLSEELVVSLADAVYLRGSVRVVDPVVDVEWVGVAVVDDLLGDDSAEGGLAVVDREAHDLRRRVLDWKRGLALLMGCEAG